ncbi:ATP-binding cassette domain-containing protein [Marinicrinis lubricantis]|uniref:ATP-binding cassette domain-containing protein n=1 Tax=Marinicrinis lubricantis TaxID=2086470 RepID=A0ABW1IQP3_9BACL
MIQVQQLVYRYPGTREPVLHGLDFDIQPGEIFGFLGPSGAGKSTVQRIILGLLKDYDGSVQVLGQEMRQFTSKGYEQIGAAFEFPNFYSRFTAMENLSLFSKLYRSGTIPEVELLERAGLADAANVRVERFSKGMKMRLNFCRAVMHQPRLLLLDEPTSGLDPANTKMMMDWIKELSVQGTAVMITTHNMHVADALCDRVAFMMGGRLPLIDSPRRLKLSHGAKRVAVEYEDGGNMRRREFPLNGIGHHSEFLQLLRNQEIETIHTMETTLEDIFMEVTGRDLA